MATELGRSKDLDSEQSARRYKGKHRHRSHHREQHSSSSHPPLSTSGESNPRSHHIGHRHHKDPSSALELHKTRSRGRDEWQAPGRQAHRHRASTIPTRRPDRPKSPSTLASSSSDTASEDEKTRLFHRMKLTSPSVVSNLTMTTSATNSSSGSNKTIKQSKLSQKIALDPPQEATDTEDEQADDSPLSPAVPDAPNVFAYLESEGSSDEETDHSQQLIRLPHQKSVQDYPTKPSHNFLNKSVSSSGSSSFIDEDILSEHHQQEADMTDQSTSPEQSDEESHDPLQTPRDPASTKLASQMAAAQRRQNNRGATQSFGTPEMQRGHSIYATLPTSLTARSPGHLSLPRGERLPITGYELLASRLSMNSDMTRPPRITPIYRRFEALNHRLLLQLQDEIQELEEQLHRLDNADTQSRRSVNRITPASRRAAAQTGGELQWHKTDILGKIGYKLAQYSMSMIQLEKPD